MRTHENPFIRESADIFDTFMTLDLSSIAILRGVLIVRSGLKVRLIT